MGCFSERNRMQIMHLCISPFPGEKTRKYNIHTLEICTVNTDLPTDLRCKNVYNYIQKYIFYSFKNIYTHLPADSYNVLHCRLMVRSGSSATRELR